MRKIPRGVYYLSLPRILKTSWLFAFNNLSPGPKVKEFEQRAANYLHADYVKAMPHARISLYYILRSYQFSKDDEVLMSPTTLPDMVNMTLLAGFKPIFADFKDNTHVIDLDHAASLITKKTKILYLTHLYGILPDMNAVKIFCKKYSLIFIQDCTQSYGCTFSNRPIVDFADSTFFSTCSLKDLHTHMGSILCTKTKERLEFITSETNRDFENLNKVYFWKFLKEDIVASLALNSTIFSNFTYYIFKIIFKINSSLIEDLIDGRGIKIGSIKLFHGLFGGSGDIRRTSVPEKMLYHFGELQAEVGLMGLERIKDFQDQRREKTLLLISMLSNEAQKRLPVIEKDSYDTFWRIPIFIDNPKDFEYFLFKHGIDPGKTTLPCLPTLPLFHDLKQDSPVAFKMGTNSIFLPNFYYLRDEEIKHVAKVVNQYFY